MNKKGDIIHNVYFVIAEMLLLAIIGLLLLNFNMEVKEDNTLEKNIIAKDSAMVIGTILSLPGNLFYIYGPPVALEKLSLAVEDGKVRVDDSSYEFGKDSRIEAGGFAIDSVSVSKIGSRLLLSKSVEVPEALSRRTCARIKVDSVLLDPGHGGDDRGELLRKKTEDEAVRELAWELNQELAAKKIAVKKTRDLKISETKSISERIPEGSETVISLHAGPGSSIVARIPKTGESYALACGIINSILKEYPKVGTAIIPYTEGRHELPYGKGSAVLLELGEDILEKDIAKLIAEGVA